MEDDKTIEEILRGMDVNTILFAGNAMGINQDVLDELAFMAITGRNSYTFTKEVFEGTYV